MTRREEDKEIVDQEEPISCQISTLMKKNHTLLKFNNGPKAMNWLSILGGPNSWS